jgi:hypothetical protein
LRLVPWLLLVAASIFAATGPVSRWLERRKPSTPIGTHPPRRLPVFICTVAVCFYIGYFGAGAGFLMITLLSLFGFQDLNEINALKVVSTTMANGIAFLIFVVDGQVVWRYCLLAMVTCAIGGYTSARFARLIPQAGAIISPMAASAHTNFPELDHAQNTPDDALSVASATASKLLALENRLRQLGSLMVAYSGGVDSAFLAATAHRVLGSRMIGCAGRFTQPGPPRFGAGQRLCPCMQFRCRCVSWQLKNWSGPNTSATMPIAASTARMNSLQPWKRWAPS